MQRNSFTYVELIYSMIIIIVLMFLSAPLFTQKAKKINANIYGEYRCTYVGVPATKPYIEQQRFNSDEMPAGVSVARCNFFRPIGAQTYRITLIGAGGGGSTAAVNNLAANSIIRRQTETVEGASGNITTANFNNIPNPFTKSSTLTSTQTNLSRNGDRVLFNNNFVVTSYTAENVWVQTEAQQLTGGKAGSVQTFIVANENMPFDANNRIIINLNNGTAINTAGIYLANTTAAGAEGRSTQFLTNVDLAQVGCVFERRLSRCTAAGGAAGGISQQRINVTIPNNSTQVTIPGGDGEFIAAYTDTPARGGTQENMAGNNGQTAGSGGSSRAYSILYNSAARSGQRIIYSNETGPVGSRNLVEAVKPTTRSGTLTRGNSGQGAGGGVIIEW